MITYRHAACLGIGVVLSVTAFAGNPDRSGEAGASQLLVNPWAKSVGWYWVNIASIRGIEAMGVNVGGLSLIEGTELGFSNTQYLVGSGISLNALGFAQRLGDGALGISVVSWDFGDIETTTTEQPEGGLGAFKPQLLNIGLAYSHSFADFIHGGVVVRLVSEAIPDVSAQGICLDGGLVYTTGPAEYPDKFKFGVSLRNVGTPMVFKGDGLTFKTDVISGNYQQGVSQLAQDFELPSQLNIGLTYDMYAQNRHRLTVAASFTSNAFYKDQFGAGLEYGLKVKSRELIQLRAALKYEEGVFNAEMSTNAHSGIAAGFTVDIPFSKEKPRPRMGLDYAWRSTNTFSGSHTAGVRLNF
jgi:hypothetical protein